MPLRSSPAAPRGSRVPLLPPAAPVLVGPQVNAVRDASLPIDSLFTCESEGDAGSPGQGGQR